MTASLRNEIADACVASLRARNVGTDTSGAPTPARWDCTSSKKGANQRAGTVVRDREGSAVSQTPGDMTGRRFVRRRLAAPHRHHPRCPPPPRAPLPRRPRGASGHPGILRPQFPRQAVALGIELLTARPRDAGDAVAPALGHAFGRGDARMPRRCWASA